MEQSWSAEAELFYEPLISTYLDRPGMVSRTWMEDQIRERLSRPSCRFVLLTGEPGAGKTGFMAALARSNPDWLRYFVRLDSTTPLSSGDATSMMLRIGHQLAHRRPEIFDPELLAIEVTQRVEHAEAGAAVVGVQIDDLKVSPFYRTTIRVQQNVAGLAGGLTGVEISRATIEPRLLELDTLSHLALLDPALVLARKAPDETIVVLVDALDELIGKSGGSTVLDWLETFAEPAPNIRFVLSSRPSDRLRTLESVRGASLEIIRIEAESHQVTEDVRRFAATLFNESQALVKAPAASPEVAISSLARAAQGNFAYLTAYSRALREAVATSNDEQLEELLKFEALPSGLSQLYAAFARRMRRQIENLGQLEIAMPRGQNDDFVPAWEGVGQRLLGVLAVAFAPLTLKQLVALGGIRVWESAASNVLQTLRPFLDEADSGWKLFHPSLGEFLTSTEATADIAIDPREWHTRVCRYYRGSASWEDIDWRKVDSYGLVHVARHIAASDDDPAALSALVTSNLRAASKERFLSELPFRRILETALNRVNTAGTVADVLTEGVFLQLILNGLGIAAGEIAPAVYGLMARLGRVDEALARADVLEPSLRKYRTLEAIWRSTPAELRAKLGPLDGVERLVDAAVEVPVTSGPMVGALGYDLGKCLHDAAVAMVPHDFERALHLAESADQHDKFDSAIDAVYAAAAAIAPPEKKLEMLSQMQKERLKPAVDAAETADSGATRDSLIAFAIDHLDDESSSDHLPLIARLLALLSKESSERPNESSAKLRSILEQAISLKPSDEESSLGSRWGVVQAAEIFRESDAELARRILSSCDRPEVDSLLASTLVDAARVWASWGQPDEARLRLNKALDVFRGLNWYGPARDIAEASVVAAGFDPQWGEALAEEAISLVEPVVQEADSAERGRLDGILAGMVEHFRRGNRERALKVARWSTGNWIHGGPWDSTDGHGGIAVIGLDAAASDPKLAEQLLAECLAGAEGGVRLGRTDAKLVNAGLFRPVDTKQRSQPGMMRSANAMASAMNSVNYWVEGRKWRFFHTPAEVLRSVDAVWPAGASWARAVAVAVQTICQIDLDRAIALAWWSADPCERLVALAALSGSIEETDSRSSPIQLTIAATLSALPKYEPEADLSSFPQAPVLLYLDPTLRARFEAALLMPSSGGPSQVLPPNTEKTWYLHMAHHADTVFNALLGGSFSQLEPEDLEQQLDGMFENMVGTDPLVKDLLEVAAIYALASKDLSRARNRIEHIASPSQKVLARVACLQFDESASGGLSAKALQILDSVGSEVPSLHRAELAAMAIIICQRANQGADGIVEWGLKQLDSTDPLMETHGLSVLAKAAPAEQRRDLLSRALRTSERIGNQYLRADAVSNMLGDAIDVADIALVTRCLDRVLDSGWAVFMDSLRRAMPSIVGAGGVEIIDRMDAAMRRSQRVLTTRASSENTLDHLDGVLAEAERQKAAATLKDVTRSIEVYLSTYLDQADVGPSMPWVQDSRIHRADAEDGAFVRLHGLQTGLSAWQTDLNQTIWRIVDIRFLFRNAADAATYHRERLEANSEGRRPVIGSPMVGEECFVFGGTDSMQLGGVTVTQTAFFYIFRVGRVVVKLFVAQGPGATDGLTPEPVARLAERIVQRIRTAGLADG